MKWYKYTIDYDYGKAELYTRKRPKNAKTLFYNLANQCFGIRKSIGETKVLSEDLTSLPIKINAPQDNNIRRHPELYDSPLFRLMASMPSPAKEIPQSKLAKANYILIHSGGD